MDRIVKDGFGNVNEEEHSTEQQSSIELSKTAKGTFSYKVKIYEDDPEKAEKKLEKYTDIARERAIEEMKKNGTGQ